MATYTFTAFNQTAQFEADNDLGVVYERGDAMGQANREFLWKLPEFLKDSQGTWVEIDRHSFRWVSGNYYL